MTPVFDDPISTAFEIYIRGKLEFYLFNRFYHTHILKGLKYTYEQDTEENGGQGCGTHNRARLQIKCALTRNIQILTM